MREADREFEYAVTGSGLMGSDLVAGSHRGVVKFADDDRGCALTWAVTFEAADNWRAALWQRVTENVIDTAAGNLAAYVATPLLHEIDLALPNCASPAAARDAFLDFVWERGGGLPVPPPLALGGERERLQLPPGLRERVVAVDDASVTYRVDNPGWGTYPVSHHRGRVSFTQRGDEGVRLRWLVAVRPLPGAAPLVKGFTRTIVNTLALNLRAHLDGDDDVSLRGPRGAGGEWGAIAADTWLGRVLKAHKGDRRGALEQAAAAARPWTWGRRPTTRSRSAAGARAPRPATTRRRRSSRSSTRGDRREASGESEESGRSFCYRTYTYLRGERGERGEAAVARRGTGGRGRARAAGAQGGRARGPRRAPAVPAATNCASDATGAKLRERCGGAPIRAD